MELDWEVLVKELGKQEYQQQTPLGQLYAWNCSLGKTLIYSFPTNDVKNKKNFEEHDAIKSILNIFFTAQLVKKIFQVSKLAHFKMLYLYL